MNRSELTHLNVSDPIANMIFPDFRVSLFCGRTLLLDVTQVDFVDELLWRHAGFRHKFTRVHPLHVTGVHRRNLGLQGIILQATQPLSLLL